MMRRFKFPATLPAVLAAGALLLFSVSWAKSQTVAASSSAGPVKLERVAPLEHPWGMDFLPDGRIIATERGGRLVIIDPSAPAQRRVRAVTGAPSVYAIGQGGLLDVAVSPDFERTGLIFLTYAERDGSAARTAAMRAKLTLDTRPRLSERRVIFRQTPSVRGGRHFGSRILVARDGSLFITTGDRGQRPAAQDKDGHIGKVIRVTIDGAAPSDNPYVSGGALPETWSIGHRNIQGAALRPSDGALWTVEHGARGGDEINKPVAGRNYGWPIISYGRHYSGGKIGQGTEAPGLEQPVYYWDPSIAPSGLTFYDGDLFPAWKGDLLVGALRFQLLSRLKMDGDRVVSEERLFEGLIGRIRDVAVGPNGAIWILTDQTDGGLWRATPRS